MGKKAKTLRDVAQMAGVSVATASRLLNKRRLVVPVNPETRRRVFEAARALNYRPNRLARGLVTDKTNIIGLSFPVFVPPDRLSPRWHAMHSASIAALLDGVEAVTFPRRYDILLLHRREYGNGGFDSSAGICADFIDGLIYASPNPRYDHFSAVMEAHVPLVMIGRDPLEREVSCVDIDNVEEVYRLTRALARKGHQRIGLILPMEREAPLSSYRLEGYKRALEEAELPFEDDLVVEAHFEDGAGRALARQLLRVEPQPTAVFVARNDLGVDVLREVKEAGKRCPDDVEIVVFGDDHSFEATDPQLTALDNSFFELGLEAAKLLFEVMEQDGAEPKQVPVPARLRMRGSCMLDMGEAEPSAAGCAAL